MSMLVLSYSLSLIRFPNIFQGKSEGVASAKEGVKVHQQEMTKAATTQTSRALPQIDPNARAAVRNFLIYTNYFPL